MSKELKMISLFWQKETGELTLMSAEDRKNPRFFKLVILEDTPYIGDFTLSLREEKD